MELRHIEADHLPLGAEEELGQSLSQLRLADAAGTQEEEDPARPVGRRETYAHHADSTGHRGHGVILAHDAPPQEVLHI